MKINAIIKKHLSGIAVVVFFLLLENITWILEPTYFGKLLDALISKFYHHHKKMSYLLPLIAWITVYLFNTLGGALSRLFSGKIYARLYVDIAEKVIASSNQQGYPTSRTLARAELAKEYINFMKDRLPEVVWQLSASFGAIIALFFYDWRIALICFTVIFPIAFIYNGFRKNMIEIQKNLHDNREDLYTLFEDENPFAIKNYYEAMVSPQSRISKWNSLNFAVTKLLMMGIFVSVLFICVDVDNFSTGTIYAIVSYLWTFILSTDYLPGLMESITSLLELNDRLKQDHNGILDG